MSGDPSIIGTSQFPNPPIRIGITKKKIIKIAWVVTTLTYTSGLKKLVPGRILLIRISTL